MSTFAFRAVDVAGVPSRGEVDAESKSQVTEQLRERGLIVLDVSEKNEAFRFEKLFDRFRGVKMRELAVFARQFATLIASGMPMLRSLYTLEDQTEDERSSDAIGEVRQDVEAGSSLADAMERRPQVFDPSLPRDGPLRRELRSPRGGARPRRLPAREARRAAAADPLRAPLPGVRLHGCDRRSCSPSSIFIVPVFVSVFKDVVQDQPGESAQLPADDPDHRSAVSNAVTGYWYIWIPVVIGLVVGFFQWKKTEWGRDQWDRVKLHLPFHIGDVVQKVAVARWSRTFSGTVAAGVPILQSIKLDRQDLGQRPGREGDGRGLRLGQGGRHDRPPDRASPTSSRRWSATWSRWARRPASSSRC